MKAKSLNNLESIGDMVGALSGISDGLDEDKYIERIIQQAHGKAANAFDAAAAGAARAGALAHVFEYGTAGITPGIPKFPDPTRPEARLWEHRIIGQGGVQQISYAFRPALNRNPQPTTASTGVPSKYLRRLSKRKYVFWNKAFVMETGRTVEIKAKNGDFLFVPFYGKASSNPMNRRGYMMWNSKRQGPLTNTPGAHTKGKFTAFWLGWWAAEGSNNMETDMRRQITTDITAAERQMQLRTLRAPLKPASAVNVHGAAARARSAINKMFGKGR